MKPIVWVIDDEPGICTSLQLALDDDYEVSTFTSSAEPLKRIERESCDVVLLDLKLGAEDGIEVLQKIKQKCPGVSVIMMTAYGSITSSVDAIKAGAYSYLTKPLDLEQLMLSISQIVEVRRMNEEILFLSDELTSHRNFQRIIGESSAMQFVYARIKQLKDVDASVLITGESGTGKELVARAIHEDGKRKSGHFVVVNCAAIPENLLELEFFGYKKGAFTGAVQDRKGKLDMADKGTIFLDEIGDMPLNLQGKLLRALQEREFTPVGSTEVRHTDVRVISATNRDLKKLIAEGKFREDLYYRLNVVEIPMPALRERVSDIPLLARHFIEQTSKEMKRKISGVTAEAQDVLMRYPFPGNVRQLQNIIEHAVIVCEKDIIDVRDFPEELAGTAASQLRRDQVIDEYLSSSTMKEIERRAIAATLKKNDGQRKKTAEALGISPHGLLNKINEYKIEL